MQSTGQRIRELREKKQMTQDQLAEIAQISKGFLSDVDNDKRNISSQGILRIAKCLGASVDYLLQGEIKETTQDEAIVIPPNLSLAAEQLGLSYSDTLAMVRAADATIARRSVSAKNELSVDDWKQLYKAIKPFLE